MPRDAGLELLHISSVQIQGSIYFIEIIFKVLAIIGYATRIIDTIQIDTTKRVFVAFNEARNPVLANMLFGELQNQIRHKLRRWRQAASRKSVNTLHKLHLHVPGKVPLSLQIGDYSSSLFCLKAAAQGGSVDRVFSGGRAEIWLLLASQISNRS